MLQKELPEGFNQRFNSMLFDSSKDNELKDIVKGIGKKENMKMKKSFEANPKFYYAWTPTEECKSSPQVFTI